MPNNLAQWTGVAVTAIVVLGSDMDMLYAVPLGVLAGALATAFSAAAAERLALAEAQRLLRRAGVSKRR